MVSFKLHKSNLVVAKQLYLVSANTQFHLYEGVVLLHPPLMYRPQLLLGISVQLWHLPDTDFFYQKDFDAIMTFLCWDSVDQGCGFSVLVPDRGA